jgi:hypothetical protein
MLTLNESKKDEKYQDLRILNHISWETATTANGQSK